MTEPKEENGYRKNPRGALYPPRMSPGKLEVMRERFQLNFIPPSRPFREAQEMGSLVSGLMRRRGGEGSGASGLVRRIAEDWLDVAGADVAKHTRPGPLTDGMLTIFVDSAVWLGELSRFGRKPLLKNLKERYGDAGIERLFFQIDPEAAPTGRGSGSRRGGRKDRGVKNHD